MNNAINQPKRPKRNITWQAQPPPDQCEHQHEVIAHEDGVALRRCVKCGSLEVQ